MNNLRKSPIATSSQTSGMKEVANKTWLANKILNIKNPYVIILTISKYSDSCDVPTAKNDGKLLHKLFKQEYKYKYIEKLIDNQILDRLTLEEFLLKQNHIIKELCNSENTISPDSIMFFYAGHGDKRGLVLGDENTMGFDEVRKIFNNENLGVMRNKPKLFHFDCKLKTCLENAILQSFHMFLNRLQQNVLSNRLRPNK